MARRVRWFAKAFASWKSARRNSRPCVGTLSEAVEAGGDASEDEIDAALAAKSAELKALGYGE